MAAALLANIAPLMFLGLVLFLLLGYPVAFALAANGLLFAGIGIAAGHFDVSLLQALPERVYGIVANPTLLAIPFFAFMGLILERSGMAEDLLDTIGQLFGSVRGGLAYAVILVGGLLAATTGVVAATVIAMGLISLPTMLNKGYSPAVATGTICASGTLGQIIPPSIILVMLADVLSNAYQQAQLRMGSYTPETVSVGELFAGALLPGLLLVVFYLLYLFIVARARPALMPAEPDGEDGVCRTVVLRPRDLVVRAVGGGREVAHRVGALVDRGGALPASEQVEVRFELLPK